MSRFRPRITCKTCVPVDKFTDLCEDCQDVLVSCADILSDYCAALDVVDSCRASAEDEYMSRPGSISHQIRSENQVILKDDSNPD